MRKLFLFPLMMLALTACLPQNNNPLPNFETAMTELAADLKVSTEGGLFGSLANKVTGDDTVTVVAVDPFMEVGNAQVIKENDTILKILAREFGPGYQVLPLSPENLGKANLVIAGALWPTQDTGRGAGYRIRAVTVNKASGKIDGHAEELCATFKFTPISAFADAPIITLGEQFDAMINTVRLASGNMADASYMKSLKSRAWLAEGDRRYAARDWAGAEAAYTQAAKLEPAKSLRISSSLYNCAIKRGDLKAAAKWFQDIVELSIGKYKKIDVKLLFGVDSAYFVSSQDLVQQYSVWLKAITNYVKANGVKLSINGHSSRSGDASYNKTLSLNRAKTVQQVMSVTWKGIGNMTTTQGFGYSQNIVGSGTDDSRDAVDRRVEFKVLN